MKFDNLELFYKLLDEADDIIFIIDTSSNRLIYANKKFEELSHYKIEDLLNKKLDELLTQDKINANIYYLNSLIFEVHPKKISFENNSYEILTVRDITENFRNEKEINQELKEQVTQLENQKIFLDTLIEKNPTAIFYKDIEGKYIGCNQAWENLTGLKVDDVIGKSVYDIAPKDIADIYYAQDEKVFSLEESPQIYNSQVYNKLLNKRFDVVFYKSAYFDRNNNVVGLIGVVVDITDIIELKNRSKQKEEIISHQSKMATMGEMIENIAHQWKQPLSTIKTVASSIKMRHEFGILEESDINDSVDTILYSTEHLNKTIDDFRDFFKRNKEFENQKIKNIFEKAIKLLKVKIKHSDVEIIEKIEDVSIFTLKNELIHVILNIINNACDAFEKQDIKKRYIFIDAFKNRDELVIEIKDNAMGIEEKSKDKIFDAYFTTKEKYDGTGIGLYMSKQIITKNLNGTIKVSNEDFEYNSKKYKGAKFIITLPLK